ncbi:MAG: aminotransferase DegT [Planctomycetes bacterium RBG_16_43_13]|nr:MAG: aminotransferase DegT [Planctomycetes bacterium RBG_16_43_13]
MIPVNEPFIGEREIEYVTECLKTGWISSAGRFIEEFEQKWADYCGMKYGIAVSNGTVALEVAVNSLDLKPGDEVIMPTFTIISCALAVIYSGAKPVLVDSEPRTWTMDVNKIEEKITDRTKAIMPVHIYGHPCNMEKIWEIADKYNLKVIEDAAEAHGAEYRINPPLVKGEIGGLTGDQGGFEWRKCGSLGDISCFSFYANKIITTGEGGMVLTNNEVYAEKARSLRNLCFKKERRFYHTELGNNFRLTNLQAAIGLAQLERIDELVKKKRWMGQSYTERLKDIPGLTLPVEEPWAKNVYWMYGVVLDETTGMDAVEFAKRLRDLGVETRPFFLGMHEQPIFHEMELFKGESYPVAKKIARQGLYLPSGLTLTEGQTENVCKAVKKAFNVVT